MRDEDKMLEKWVGPSTCTVFDMAAIVGVGDEVVSTVEGAVECCLVIGVDAKCLVGGGASQARFR